MFSSVRNLVPIAWVHAGSAEMQCDGSRLPQLVHVPEQHPIASEHARAICEEIGERLRYALRGDYTDFPPRLRELMDRLAQLDCDVPSLVPTMEDMTRALVEAD